MASPVDAGRVATAFAAVDPWNVALPAGIVAGDLLILYLRTGTVGQPQNHPTPNGFANLFVDSADATDDSTFVYYKWADGTEGTTLVLDMNIAIKGAAIVWRVTGAANPATQPPQVSAMQVFTTTANTGNAPAISPTGGSKDYLFITCIGYGGTSIPTGIPTNYSSGVWAGAASTGGSAATNCVAHAVSRQATTATEDVGAWTHPAATGGGIAFTIAIHPGGPPPKTVTINDGLALGDGFGRTRAAARTLTDLMALADARARTVEAFRSWAEVISLADLVTPEITVPSTAHTRSAADTLALADMLARASGKTRADTLALADSLTRVRTVSRAISDVVTLQDAGLYSEADAVAIIDSLLLTDLASTIRGYTRSRTDTVPLADLLARASGRGRSFADTVVLADSTSRVMTGASAPWPRQIALAI